MHDCAIGIHVSLRCSHTFITSLEVSDQTFSPMADSVQESFCLSASPEGKGTLHSFSVSYFKLSV